MMSLHLGTAAVMDASSRKIAAETVTPDALMEFRRPVFDVSVIAAVAKYSVPKYARPRVNAARPH